MGVVQTEQDPYCRWVGRWSCQARQHQPSTDLPPTAHQRPLTLHRPPLMLHRRLTDAPPTTPPTPTNHFHRRFTDPHRQAHWPSHGSGVSGPISEVSGPIGGALGPIGGTSSSIGGASGLISGVSGLIGGVLGPISGASGPISGVSGPTVRLDKNHLVRPTDPQSSPVYTTLIGEW